MSKTEIFEGLITALACIILLLFMVLPSSIAWQITLAGAMAFVITPILNFIVNILFFGKDK